MYTTKSVLAELGLGPGSNNIFSDLRKFIFSSRQVDFALPRIRLALEYEGEHHLTDPVQWAKDIARMERLIELGWRVMRVTQSDLFGPPELLVARIRRAIDAAR